MAAKKIGAIIALDGEKSFKQSVTNCNKSLTSLKSEMALVKAESEGQANSLENLQKKHTVLSKILDEQKNKENEIVKALDHAKESYENVGKGIQTLTNMQTDQIKKVNDLKTAYSLAQKQLDEMTASGDTASQGISEQENVVKSLADELKKEEQTLKDVNAALEKGEKNYQTAEGRIKDWEAKLNTARAQIIKTNGEINRNAAYMKEAQEATDKCATSIDAFGKEVQKAEEFTLDFADVLKANLSNTVVDSMKNLATGAATAIVSMESAQRQFQASTGASTAQMREYNSVMSELNRNNYGEDMNDIAESMALIRQYTGELDPDKLEQMTENGIAMRDVFGMDLSETIRGIDALMENMGLTGEEAFDLIAAGAQNGLDKSGELTDNIAEYSQLWAQAGFSAQEMFTILQNGLDSGAYNLDKVNDFVKEFTISLSDGRIEENLDSFSAQTRTLFKNWQDGKVTSKQVFYSVINDLANATNKQEALTVASNTWSSLGEDNALAVITSLDDLNDTYENVQGTMEEIKDIKYDTLESRYKQLGRTFMAEVGEPIAEKVLPMMEDGLDFVAENLDEILALLGGIGAAVVTYKIATTVQETVTAVSAFTKATEGATVAQQAMNLVSSANPYVLLATAIVGVTTAVIALGVAAGDTAGHYSELAAENQEVIAASQQTRKEIDELGQTWSGTVADIAAQEGFSNELITELYGLEGQSGKTSGEIARMSQIVEQLNTMYPDLNLSLDENTGKLSATEEATRSLTEAQMEQIKAEAARKQLTEIIEKQTEAELNLYKLKQQEEEIQEQQEIALQNYNDRIKELTDSEYNLVTTSNLKNAALEDYALRIDELNSQLEANKEETTKAEESVNALHEEYQYVDEYLKDMTGIEDTTNDLNSMGEAATNTAAATDAAIAAIEERYQTAVTDISEVVSSQMNLFEQFDASVDLSTADLLANMQSQIDGVSNWADNIQILADRGINQGLLGYLAEMGPQGAGYVALFAQMSDTELKKANEMWSQSMTLQESVSNEVADAMTGYTEALQEATPGIIADTKNAGNQVGVALPEGIEEGVLSSTPMAMDTLSTLVTKMKDMPKEELEINSPSKVYRRYGQALPEGIAEGVSKNTHTASGSVKSMLSSIQVTAAAQNMSIYLAYYNIGTQIPAGMANGITARRSLVINAVARLCASAESTARSRLQIRSPSKIFETLGKYTAEGFGIGYEKKMANVRSMINDSMAFSGNHTGSVGVSGGDAQNALTEKIVIELPIYTGKNYTKTEIVEIARNGISSGQKSRYRAKGVIAGV